ncbi:hypothetical protein ACA910_015412 [Epithemia clementina (nom. ined.)]
MAAGGDGDDDLRGCGDGGRNYKNHDNDNGNRGRGWRIQSRDDAKADKKATQVAAEGRIALGVALPRNKMVLMEINCKTDFVAKDLDFVQFCQQVAQSAVQLKDGDDSV